ncbi:hypothetical protein like AT5G07610 [Hibiscus trionum]|uniref:F-box domain-containing protein n=1 Tax=Hibiscus trionum TaxID=183268 RepID=A0A9W7IHV0_HIBTR|nr:hypothetical protein like AT5G07610 [Hibiscus trionum]
MEDNYNDIHANILAHLPEKSLLRFRNVSKQWFYLISSAYFSQCLNRCSMFPSGIFLKMHHSSNRPIYHFLSLHGKPFSDSFRSLTFVDDSAGIRILQSCNGILLCCSNRRIGENTRNYYIYNPTTNQYATIPKPGNRTPNTIFGVILAFDPSKSPHYKVVFVRSSRTFNHLYQLEIYSSETRLWSFSSEVPKFNYSKGAYCSGFIHWMTNSGASLRFDVDRERFQEIPLPDDWNQHANIRYFKESGGLLHLILTNGRHSTRQFDVYEMEKDTSRWFVKYRVDLDALISEYPEMVRSNSGPSDWDYHAFRVLAVVVSKENEGSFLVLHIPGKAISYNFKHQTSTLLHDFAPGCTHIEGCITIETDDSFPYIGTLAIV